MVRSAMEVMEVRVRSLTLTLSCLHTHTSVGIAGLSDVQVRRGDGALSNGGDGGQGQAADIDALLPAHTYIIRHTAIHTPATLS